MGSNTENLGLYKADPIADKNNTFNIQTLLNDNWDKIDTAVIAKLLEAKGYTDTQITALIASAPTNLNTLKKIADAIGNDPSFVTTITNLINTKVNNSDVVTTATANKILKLDVNSKLPANITGNADGSASKLAVARTISVTGDISGSTTFDGSTNANITAALPNTGVTAGTYPKVTVDAKGRVTGGTSLSANDIPNLDYSKITTGKPTTLSGYGITDALPSSSYTASDVLAKIKTVDGNGSGLDADTLRGYVPSDFTPSGYGFEASAKVMSGTDLNALKNNGIYLVKHGSNYPSGESDWAHLFVQAFIDSTSDYGSRIVQLFKHDTSNRFYYREYTSSVWTSWVGIANLSDIPTDLGGFSNNAGYAKRTEIPTTLPASGGTADHIGNAVNITDYNTLTPSLISQGSVTPIKAPSTANSPWNNTTSGFLIQSNDTDSFHIMIFRSGGDGWAYRSYYQGIWSSWKIWSTFDGNYNNLSNKPASLPANGGHSDTASKLSTARTISLTGDATGSATFDGSANASITVTVADNSHNHVISNVDGLQVALDGKAASSHTHTKAQITDMPTSLPANGGNSDTVDNLHGTQFMRSDTDTSTTGNMTVGKTLTVNKQGTTSTIAFPAQTNDAGSIQHIENNNVAEMRFSVSDDASDTDFFTWGANPSGTWQEKARLTSAGNMTLNGSINAKGGLQWNGQSLDDRYASATNATVNFANSKFYNGGMSGGTDLDWKSLFRMTGADRSGNGAATSTGNNYDGGTVMGYVYIRNGNYNQSRTDRYQFQFTLYAWGGTGRQDIARLHVPSGIPDVLRVIKYGINDYELQIRVPWNYCSVNFEMWESGNSNLSNYAYKSLASYSGTHTVVKSNSNHDEIEDASHAKDVKVSAISGLTSGDKLQNVLSSLFQSVDNGKDNVYSAIVGKGVTPASKDFADLTTGINNIKRGQGNAVEADVLSGRTFANDDGVKRTGTMANRPNRTAPISTSIWIDPADSIAKLVVHIPKGAYLEDNTTGDNSTTILSSQNTIRTENIKSGITILGVAGKSSVVDTADATAVAGDMLSGKIAYINGTKTTGTMANKSAQTNAVSVGVYGTTLYARIPQGAYLTNAGTGYPEIMLSDPELVAENIVSGKNIFGVTGTGSTSNIKSVQRGSTTFNSVATVDIPISTVNLANSIVIVDFIIDNTSNIAKDNLIQGKLTSSTNLHLTMGAASTATKYVEWQVIEFQNVKSIQRGENITNNGSIYTSGVVTISSVDTTKAVVFASAYTTSANASSNPSDYARITTKLASSTQLYIRNAGQDNVYVAWYVVEFY